MDQQPEGEYILDSKSDSLVCVEYSGDRYDDEVYDQFANQAEPRLTEDHIGNYILSADQNSYDIKPIRSPSCVHLSEEVNTLHHEQEIKNSHYDKLSNAFDLISNVSTMVSCHEDKVFISENLGDVEQSNNFRPAEDEEDNLPFSDLQVLSNLKLEHVNHDPECVDVIAAYAMSSPHFSDLQTKAVFSPCEESDGDKETSSPDQLSIGYAPPIDLGQPFPTDFEEPSPVDLERFTHIIGMKEEQLQHSQLEQQSKEVLCYDFKDPMADFLDSISNMDVKIFVSEEDYRYHSLKPFFCMIWFSFLFGSRIIMMPVNQFMIWLHWKSSFT